MAVYRIHRKEWDKGIPSPGAVGTSKKRKASLVDADADDEDTSTTAVGKKGKASTASKHERTFPGGGRKGVSSGLSTIVKRTSGRDGSSLSERVEKKKSEWWKELGESLGAKGSMSLKAR